MLLMTVINAVLENLAHKILDHLPSKTSLCNMMVECLTLAQAQLGEELSCEGATSQFKLMALVSMDSTLVHMM